MAGGGGEQTSAPYFVKSTSTETKITSANGRTRTSVCFLLRTEIDYETIQRPDEHKY